jgi:hypothetical protein
MTRRHQRSQLLQLGLHRRAPKLSHFGVANQIPTLEVSVGFLGSDSCHILFYYERASWASFATARLGIPASENVLVRSGR